jgi:hypothetical protein
MGHIGGGSANTKGQSEKRKKKKEKEDVLTLGGGRTTPKGHGMVRPPPKLALGVAWPK